VQANLLKELKKLNQQVTQLRDLQVTTDNKLKTIQDQVKKLATTSTFVQTIPASPTKKIEIPLSSSVSPPSSGSSSSSSSSSSMGTSDSTEIKNKPKPKPVDPKIEIEKLLSSQQFDLAFHWALSLGQVDIVVWLCSQVDPRVLLATKIRAHQLSSPVILSLLQQLGFQLGEHTMLKLSWIKEAAMALNPLDPLIARYVPFVLQEVIHNLDVTCGPLIENSPADPLASTARLVRHLLQAVLR